MMISVANKMFAASMVLLLLFTSSLSEPVSAQDSDPEFVYELRTYTTAEGKLDDLQARFKDHTIKLFEKHGIANMFYSIPADKKNTLVYVVRHASREKAKKSWKNFIADPDWKKAFKESRKNGGLVTKVESLFLEETDFSPQQVDAAEEVSRVFEFRTYTTAKGRLPNLLKRFREGETDLFEKHGMTNIIFWTPSDKKNTMVYVVAHKDPKAAEKSWKAFREDPVWKEMHKKSLESGPIVTKVQKMFVTPTEYSPFK